MLDFLGRLNGRQVLSTENLRAPGVKARARPNMRSVVSCGRGQNLGVPSLKFLIARYFSIDDL